MSKTIQARVSDQERALIRLAFEGDNLSKFIRDFLMKEVESRLQRTDMSVQSEDPDVRDFIAMMSHPDVQKTLYHIFKSAHVKDPL